MVDRTPSIMQISFPEDMDNITSEGDDMDTILKGIIISTVGIA